MNRIQKKFICDAVEDPEPLTEWEYDFINDLADKGGDPEYFKNLCNARKEGKAELSR